MSDFVDTVTEEVAKIEVSDDVKTTEVESVAMIDPNVVVTVEYCPHCTMPFEYCQYGTIYESKCLPYIQEHRPELLKDGPAEGDEKKKRAVVTGQKKKAEVELKIILQLKQGAKRKIMTHIRGLDAIPDVKIKDISRAFSKQFSCGASVDDIPTGGKEVVIQGDFMFQTPDILIKNYKIPPTSIFINEGGSLRCYA